MPVSMKNINIPKLAVLILLSALPAIAQQGNDATRALTAADYARAEKWMPYNTSPLVFRSGVRPTWVADERFWYRITTPEGSEFLLVEAAAALPMTFCPRTKSARPLFATSICGCVMWPRAKRRRSPRTA